MTSKPLITDGSAKQDGKDQTTGMNKPNESTACARKKSAAAPRGFSFPRYNAVYLPYKDLKRCSRLPERKKIHLEMCGRRNQTFFFFLIFERAQELIASTCTVFLFRAYNQPMFSPS